MGNISSNFSYLRYFDIFYKINILKNIWSNKSYKFGFLILEVCLFCNKFDIKKSIEFIFNVKVLKINIIIKKYFYRKGKSNKFIKKKKAFIKFI